MKVLGWQLEQPREKEGLHNAANMRVYAFKFMLLLLLVFLPKKL